MENLNFWVMLNYATSHNEPQRATTTHNKPQRAATTQNKPQRARTTYDDPQRPTTSHNKLQRFTTTTQKIAQYNFMYTLCFIYKKIIISCFYGLLFLILSALLFSFVNLKLHTYHNSCLPSDLTKLNLYNITTIGSKNNTKLRLLSKKCQIIYFQLSDFHHSLIRHMLGIYD